jgi:hypothetical protein
MSASNWLCLDCGKSTLGSKADYYMLRNQLWRQLVPRDQRHRMLCLACVEIRLGRPLVPDDYLQHGSVDDESDPEDAPMGGADYGIMDSLNPKVLQSIDAALLSYTSSRPRKVGAIVGIMMSRSPAAIPGLPDSFYIERIGAMIESGVLSVVQMAERPVDWVVCLACGP